MIHNMIITDEYIYSDYRKQDWTENEWIKICAFYDLPVDECEWINIQQRKNAEYSINWGD